MNNIEQTIQGLNLALMQNLRPMVAEKLTEQLVADFRKQIEPIVAEAVKDVTLDHVRAFRDATQMREELDVLINGVKINENTV